MKLKALGYSGIHSDLDYTYAELDDLQGTD